MFFADTSTKDAVSLHDTQDNIRLSVQPTDESGSKTILLTIKDGTSLKNGTVDFTYQDQTISYRLPDQYVAADQTTTTTSEATDRTDTTTSESDTTTPSSEESNRSDRAAVSSAGAIFKVVDETGATVAENLATNEAGLVTVDGLAPGQYSFVETQAPTGYQISDEAIKFVIASHAAGQPTEVDAGQLINHLIPNTPNTPNTPEKPSGKLPKTNDTSNRWLALIGGSIVVLTSTAGFYFNKKRKS